MKRDGSFIRKDTETVLNDATDSSTKTATAWQRFKTWRTNHPFFSLVFELVFMVIFIVIPFRSFIAQPFMVSGDSMVPTFANRDYLIVNQLEKRFGDSLDRYDVVIFKYPGDESKYYIKRIIALPGETVVVVDGITTVFNDENPEGFEITDTYATGQTIGSANYVLASDEYFVMGDNRENSSDSRFWGPLKENNIIGTPFIRLFPADQAGLNPGSFAP